MMKKKVESACHSCGKCVKKGDFEIQFGQIDTYDAEYDLYLVTNQWMEQQKKRED